MFTLRGLHLDGVPGDAIASLRADPSAYVERFGSCSFGVLFDRSIARPRALRETSD